MTARRTQVDQDLCIGCAMCVSICDKVYELSDDTSKAYIKENAPFLETSETIIQETIESCPVGAIDFITNE